MARACERGSFLNSPKTRVSSRPSRRGTSLAQRCAMVFANFSISPPIAMTSDCPIGSDLARASELLREGGIVAFGTETVYGLGASVEHPKAIARVFEVKNRPTFDPLIVHVAEQGQVDDIALSFPPMAQMLAEAFWPGPLTLVVPKRDYIPDLVTAGRPTVAIRIPGSEKTRELLRAAGVPIAAPSANPFGRISPTTARHVADQLGGQIDYIYDCGPCEVGIESTVLDITSGTPWLLRPGGVNLEDIEEVIGPVQRFQGAEIGAQRAPGMLTKHYAPRTALRILPEPMANGRRIGVLSLGAIEDADQFASVEVLSPSFDLTEAAANFFAALRRLDAAGLDEIQATPFPSIGVGRALNDRLRRAAATHQ